MKQIQHTAAILATNTRTSARGNAYHILTIDGIAQPVTIFDDTAQQIRAAWPTLTTDDKGRKLVPLIITVSKQPDSVNEHGEKVAGRTNVTAQFANVNADTCPFG